MRPGTDLDAGAAGAGTAGRRPVTANLTLAVSLTLSGAVLLIVGVILWQAREEAWERAAITSGNLVRAIAVDIEQSVDLYGVVLADIVQDFQDPAVTLSPEARFRFLSRAAAASPDIGSVLLLDAHGDIIGDSAAVEPRRMNVADRDYFQVHANSDGIGVYLSRPFRSRLRDGDPAIALSRRLEAADGSFAGVAVIGVRLAYFRALFERFDIGPDGVLRLTRLDGTILMRQPSADGEGDIGRDASNSPDRLRALASPSGSFLDVARIDGQERFYTYTHVPGLPLIVTVGLSADEIFAGWRRRALLTSSLTVLICAVAAGFAFRLRREILRRAEIEAHLAVLSVTDALTRLANRRRFDETLDREWRRARREGASLAVLMIDVDRFKLLNDRFGHARGDEVLQAIARSVEASLRRPGDLAARYGGEEFVAILPATDITGALVIAERIRARVEAGDGWNGLPSATVSIGVSVVRPKTGWVPSDLVAAADKALYCAKNAGRNRVAVEVLETAT